MSAIEIFKLVSAILVPLTGLAGGAWGLYQFVKLRKAKKALKLNMITSIHRTEDRTLIEIVVELVNTGSVVIKGRTPNNERSTLEIKGIPIAKEDTGFTWSDPRLIPLTEPIQYLVEYDDPRPKYYLFLEPSVPCEVFGHAVLSIDFDGFVLLQARFFDRDEFEWLAWKLLDVRKQVSPMTATTDDGFDA